MFDFKTLNEISRHAISAMQTNSAGNIVKSKISKFVFFVLFFLLPLAVASLPFYTRIRLDGNFSTFIATSVAIFVGLFFSLLLSIGSKIKKERDNKNRDDDNFKKFKNTAKQISEIIIYIIKIGLILMMTVAIDFIINDKYVYVNIVLTSFALLNLSKFFISIILMGQRFFFIIRDEIDNIV